MYVTCATVHRTSLLTTAQLDRLQTRVLVNIMVQKIQSLGQHESVAKLVLACSSYTTSLV